MKQAKRSAFSGQFSVFGLFCVLCASAVSSARATTYFVDGWLGNDAYDGSTNAVTISSRPKRTITAALAVSVAGDQIQVAPGFYQETNWQPDGQTLVLPAVGTAYITDADPTTTDQDIDLLPDAWEARYGSNPFLMDAGSACQHPYAHGLSNLQVFQNPSVLLADGYSTVNDGIPDWWKVKWAFLLNDPAIGLADADLDGYTNVQEFNEGTDPLNSTNHPAYLPADFASWWKLDEGYGTNTFSEIGTNLTGVLVGNPLPVWISGITSNGLVFDGSQNEVIVADDSQLTPTNALTISAWVKTATNLTSDVIGKWSTNQVAGSYLLALTNGCVIFDLMIDSQPTGIVSIVNLSSANWHHLAGTYDGQRMDVYLDGESVGTLLVTGYVTVVSEPLRMGLLAGQLDDVRLYNYALTSEAVLRLRDADTDGDGMPDWWEADTGLNALNAMDANGDTDNDGYTNLAEFQSGSSPTTTDPMAAALDQFQFHQVDWLRGLCGLSAVIWNHSETPATRIGQLRTALEQTLPYALDLVVNPAGSLGQTNVVCWTLPNVLSNVHGTATANWLTGAASLAQIEELTNVMARITHLPVRGDTVAGMPNTHVGYADQRYIKASRSFQLIRPPAWPATASVQAYLQFEEFGGPGGSVVDDWLSFNTTDAPDESTFHTTQPVWNVTAGWQSETTNTLHLWDCGNCGGDLNYAYLSPFHPVLVLTVPSAPTVTFSKADVCGGFDDWTGWHGAGSNRDFRVWLAVPVGGSNTLTATLSDTGLVSNVRFESANTGIATVMPTNATAAATELTVQGVAAGETLIHAKVGGVTLASFHADVLPLKTNVTVAIFAVTATGNPATTPTNVPTAGQLQDKLNAVYGKQANVWFSVTTNNMTQTVNYDVACSNGCLEVPRSWICTSQIEMDIIHSNITTTASLRAYFVHEIYNPWGTSPAGYAQPGQHRAYIMDTHQGSSAWIVTHEFGHALAGFGNVTAANGLPDRLMWETASTNEPCRLIRQEWKDISTAAGRLP